MEDAFRFLFAQKSVTRTVVPPFLQNVSTGGVELGIAFRRPFSKNKKKNEKGGVFLLDISGNFSYNKTHRATLLLLHEGGFIMFRGVAQLVARLLWEQDVVGSSPATPTTSERTLFRSDFCLHKNRSHTPSFRLFRKKARSVCLFICKRTHNGKLSLPPFCDFKVHLNRSALPRGGEEAGS